MVTTVRARPRGSGFSFELWSWYYFRVSGVLLLFLALGHLFIMHILDGGVDRVNFAFVAGRWANLLWRSYDFLLLFLALTHGLNGIRVIIDDYIQPEGWRVFAQSTLFVVGLVFLVLGALVLFTFQVPGR